MGLPPNSWEAYQLDCAVLALGTHVEQALANRKKGEDAGRLLRRLLDEKPKGGKAQEFRKLWHPGVRKMTIPESGVW